MPAYFVDSWYFIALLDPRDSHHRNAHRLRTRAAAAALVTHDGVLTEVLAYFSEEGSHARGLAVQAVHDALMNNEVVSVGRAIFLRALNLYERRPDKEYSLTDCISMVLMRERGITHVLTNDHHFRQEGFTVLADAS